MSRDVAIVGIGQVGYRSMIGEAEVRELAFEASMKAYDDAGIDPRKDVGSFIHCQEDMWEGTSISSEYSPDQLGAALRPICTVAGDGLFGIITAYMQIVSGLADVAVVASHAKPSDIVEIDKIKRFTLDPIFNRPICTEPLQLASLGARRFMHRTRFGREDFAEIVSKNMGNALYNPRAAYPLRIQPNEITESEPSYDPLSKYDVAQHADGALTVVMAEKRKARRLIDNPVFVLGVGWASETPWLEDRDHSVSEYAHLASESAYRKARITKPSRQIDFMEVDDTFSYKELEHLESMGGGNSSELRKMLRSGDFGRSGALPVNPSGGCLGMGHLLEATGLSKLFEAVLQLRGEAGPLQVHGARKALVQSWRGTPTGTGAVIVLGA